jgi:Fe-S cluster assembly iron-binding protein IscA
MLTVSESAVKELDEFFADKEKSPVRVYLAAGGCGGPRLALALDEPKDDDKVFDEGKYAFCVNKELFDQTGDISIDLSYLGFTVDSANSVGGGGGCGGCASHGGCGGAR